VTYFSPPEQSPATGSNRDPTTRDRGSGPEVSPRSGGLYLAVQFLILFSFVSFVSFVSLLLILAPWRLTTFRFLYPDKAVIAEARI
jgi:hypothetical protein